MPYTTEQARAEFDGWSDRYDRDPLQTFFFRPTHRRMQEWLGNRNDRVLDVGCGTGQFALQLAGTCPGIRVCGIDLSAGMLRHAGHRCQPAGKAVSLLQADSGRLPFADDSFDAVTCAHSFHHYPDQRRVVCEMYRVLRPGGRLLIVDGDRDGCWGRFVFDCLVVLAEGPVRHLSARSYRRIFAECGFSEVRQWRRGGPLPFLLTSGEALKDMPSVTAA